MVGDRVHHDGEGDDVTAHDKDREQDLAQTEQFTAESAHEDFTGIGQVVNVRMPLAELANDISSVKSENTKTDNQDERSVDEM